MLRDAVLLFDFGAQVEGYRSDMTRTLFVGEPTERDLAVYDLVRAAQQAAIDWIESSVAAGAVPPSRRELGRDRPGRDRRGWPMARVRPRAGARHRPRHPRAAALRPGGTDDPLPGRTVFSVEPGIYLEGETGVRIEDLVHIDVDAGSRERLTQFPRDVIAAAPA